ncbi:PREDICTED: uncharacterized protein LOC105557357 [Vollenhovia emeryi]|uniref:uncharacterized protein LOC105557357 n=1 Tax=Vollenhovia emeryi TaxID=411798 RepID=UPI0005F45C70|nr:PREDICTED: uncharacterized protein LOC105557357 [Vollenhovia emeryi]
MAKIVLLKARPVQCFRCWDFGHVRGGCRSPTERGRACFNCGGEDHALRECSFPSCCVVCRDKGLNPEHSRASQDLMTQYILENRIGVCCFAEPWRIPADNAHWISSSDSTAAILWSPEFVGPGCVVFHRSNNIIGVSFGDVRVISVYISPNISIGRFLEAIDRLSDAVASAGGPVIICGDFNAKSGSSIVDLTWVSAQYADKVKNWSVICDMETLSDHRLIAFVICDRPVNNVNSANISIKKPYPRWSIKGLDAELLASTFEFLSSGLDANRSPDCLADDVGAWISDTCDVAARRAGIRPPRRTTYWWNEEVATTRRVYIAARRKCSRARASGNPNEELDRVYRVAKRTLRKAIKIAKSNAWKELLLGVEDDLWGLPYKMVMGCLRRSSPALSETLSPDTLGELMDSLFPEGETHSPDEIWHNWDRERFVAADHVGILEVWPAPLGSRPMDTYFAIA